VYWGGIKIEGYYHFQSRGAVMLGGKNVVLVEKSKISHPQLERTDMMGFIG